MRPWERWVIRGCAVVCGTTLLILAMLLGRDPAPPADPGEPAVTVTDADMYAAYLRTAPAGAPELSREDALRRALLGCGQQWPAGTVDAALSQAYAALCAGQR